MTLLIKLLIITILLPFALAIMLKVLRAAKPYALSALKPVAILFLIACVAMIIIDIRTQRDEARTRAASLAEKGLCESGPYIYNCADAPTHEAKCELFRRNDAEQISRFKSGKAVRERMNEHLAEAGCAPLPL